MRAITVELAINGKDWSFTQVIPDERLNDVNFKLHLIKDMTQKVILAATARLEPVVREREWNEWEPRFSRDPREGDLPGGNRIDIGATNRRFI